MAFSLKLPNQEFGYDNSPEHTLRSLNSISVLLKMAMFKRRAKNKPSRTAVKPLQLNAQMYLSLLALQLLNLLTLVTQLHVVYLVFAVFVLLVQFTTHIRLKNKFFGSDAANKTANLSKSKGSTFSEHFLFRP